MKLNDLVRKESKEVKVKVVDWKYDESENSIFQGKVKEVKERSKGGYYFIRGGNGSYNMQKNAEAKLRIAFNGTERDVKVNDEVKAYTEKSKISQKQLIDVFEDCRSGKAEIFYNEQEKKVRIIKKAGNN